MNLTEIIDTLIDIGTQLQEIAGSPHFDTGQRLMVTQAEVRLAQVAKELTEFDAD